MLKVIDDFDKHEKGLMTFQPRKLVVSRQALDRLQHKPKVLVEMGVYVGVSQSQQMMLQKPDRWQQFSAVAWGAMLRDINAGCDEDCKVYACELDPEFARIARDFVELAGLQDIVKVLEGLATESVARLKSEGSLSSLDVLFLDHWQDAYLPDLRFCERLGIFRSGSIVIADNTDWPGAPDYLSYVRAGGSGAEGGIRYRTKTYETEAEGHKSTVS